MIDGNRLALMFVSGANNLYNNKEKVDALNVFPVPDGDTGTNMSMTAQAMARALLELRSDSVSKTADTMAHATLRAARGNSGVILSQFFRGIQKGLKNYQTCDAKMLAAALKLGSDTAYNAVMNPTEGTILTVARELAEEAQRVSQEGEDIIPTLELALIHGKDVLDKTPDMLPALKKAGVVDAGGQGWICIVEGAIEYLKTGKIVEKIGGENADAKSDKAQSSIDTSDIKYSYCTEFIIEKSNPGVNVLGFRQSIETIGDSMLVIDDDDIVKVHIHTNNPGFVLEKAIKIGALINIKIDNMKQQHQNLLKTDELEPSNPIEEEEAKVYGSVAVCVGDGISAIFKDLGIDYVIEGGQTMNPSTEDILEAVNKINAETIFVFPNNKNIILAASQAAELTDKRVEVIPTKDAPSCIAAMLAFNPDSAPEDNVAAFEEAISAIKTGQVTFAVRDTHTDDFEIKKDDFLGIAGSKIVAVGKERDEILCELISKLADDDSEFLTVYCGEDVESLEDVEAFLEEKFPDLEVSVQSGGQPIYPYILSVE